MKAKRMNKGTVRVSVGTNISATWLIASMAVTTACPVRAATDASPPHTTSGCAAPVFRIAAPIVVMVTVLVVGFAVVVGVRAGGVEALAGAGAFAA